MATDNQHDDSPTSGSVRDLQSRRGRNQTQPGVYSRRSRSRNEHKSTFASQESREEDEVSFESIIIPDEDMTGTGPLRRSHINPARVDYSAFYREGESHIAREDLDISRLVGRSMEDPDHTEANRKMARLQASHIPPGPRALEALREQIPPYLLSQLPGLREMVFESHIRLRYAQLHLLVGTYSQKNIFRWGNKVWAYLRLHANPNTRVGPQFEMEVQEDRKDGGHVMIPVTWTEDLEANRVHLQKIFKDVRQNAELRAVVKYYFLLAVEAGLHGFKQHCIPVNLTFVQELTKVCSEYGTHDSLYDGSQLSSTDVEQLKATKYHARRHRSSTSAGAQSIARRSTSHSQPSTDWSTQRPTTTNYESAREQDSREQTQAHVVSRPATQDTLNVRPSLPNVVSGNAMGSEKVRHPTASPPQPPRRYETYSFMHEPLQANAEPGGQASNGSEAVSKRTETVTSSSNNH